jgi:CDP-diacylglycerol pyrophosphatase
VSAKVAALPGIGLKRLCQNGRHINSALYTSAMPATSDTPNDIHTDTILRHSNLRGAARAKSLLHHTMRWAAALTVAFTATACARLATIDSNALWKIVDVRCVPSQQATGTPGQCTVVNLDKRYVILKDILGPSQHLLIPTDRISGVESPLVLAPNAQDYWADAWDSRQYVEKSLKRSLPDNLLGLEINAESRRSQNQLHIHIDCMRGDVSEALARHANDATGVWQWDTLDGNRYRIMRVTSLTQGDNPFQIVARDNPHSDAMAMQTILVTAAGPSAEKDGWLIVNSGIDVDNGSGSAESLLDHACRVANAQ